jgi:NTE family protein
MNKKQMVKVRPRIGIALGSGGARGYAHIGVLKALHEANIPIDVIAGTSMGAVVGAAYAIGYRIEELEDMALQMRWKWLFNLIDPAIPRQGIIAGNKVEKYFKILTKGKVFEQLEKHLIVVATDITSGEEVRINSGPVARALRASIAIPGVFSPIKSGQSLLVDGSVTTPVPIMAAIEAGAEIVVAVDVSSNVDQTATLVQTWKRLKRMPSKKIFQIIDTQKIGRFIKNSQFEIVNVIGNTLELCNQPKEVSKPTSIANKHYLLLKPDVGDVRWYEFHRVRECIHAGEVVGKQVAEQIKYFLSTGNFLVEPDKQNGRELRAIGGN